VKEVERARREFARQRQKREPLRIVITSDPRRPIRTIVIPARLPFVAVGAAMVVVLLAVGLAFAAWSLRGAVGRLSLRMSAMTDAADELARYPLPAGAGLLQAAALDAGSWRARARPERNVPPERLGRLELESVNTGEQLTISLDLTTGEPDEQSYRAVRRFMRCLRTGAETPMDPRLIELLYRISQRASGRKILLVSGFRAPMFSAVAFSYHPRGMAADIRIPGMTALMVRDLVTAMGVKGVGYYPTSQFVHVDVRDTRAHWIDYSTKSDEDSSSHGESQPGP
jgi:uncharacterized protein YcbK (DUF882 family)